MATQLFGGVLSNNADMSYDTVLRKWTFQQIVSCGELAGVTTMVAHVHQAAGSGETLDHGAALTGLADDDHTQYAKAFAIDVTRAPYSATGNGSTNDTAAVQAALTAAAAAPKGVVVFPSGTYKCSQLTIPATAGSIILQGDAFETTLQQTGADPLFVHGSASPAHVTFRDLDFTQTAITDGDIISFAGSISAIVFDHCVFHLSNAASTAVVLAGSSVAYCEFDRVFAYQAAGATAPLIDISATSPGNVFGVSIENSAFWGTVTGAAPLVVIDTKGGEQGFGPMIRNTYFEIPQAGAVHCYSMAHGHFDGVWAGDVTGPTAPLFLFTESAASAVESEAQVFTGSYVLGGSVAQPDIKQTGSASSVTIINSRVPIVESVVAPIIINPYGSLTFVGATPEAYWLATGVLKTPSITTTRFRVGRWLEWTGRSTGGAEGAFGAAKAIGYVNLGSGGMDGLIEISITDTYASANASGVLTKQFAVIRAATAAATQSSRISETVGNVSAVFNIGELELNGTNLRIPINWISGTENLTVRVRALFSTESFVIALLAALSITDPTGTAAAAAVQYVSWPYMQDVSAVSGAVWKCPADATDPTGGGGAAVGRIPINIGGVTKYIPYY